MLCYKYISISNYNGSRDGIGGEQLRIAVAGGHHKCDKFSNVNTWNKQRKKQQVYMYSKTSDNKAVVGGAVKNRLKESKEMDNLKQQSKPLQRKMGTNR